MITKFRTAIILCFLPILMMALTSCDLGTREETVVLPTALVIATFTPSITPTATDTATPTETATNTPTATNTATFTPSSTNLPTATFTPSITPTPTATHTPPATDTSTAEPTSSLPRIFTFTTSTDRAAANATITLSWGAESDITRIDEQNNAGAVLRTFSVTAVGQLPIVVPSNAGSVVIYQLTAQRGGQSVSRSLTVNLACPISWFFGDALAQAHTNQCPINAAVTAQGSFQTFERGIAIYINANGANKVYGLEGSSGRYSGYTSQWNSSATSVPNIPPPGLLEPQGVFQWLYYNTSGPSGNWNTNIGWGTTNIDLSNRTIQYESTSDPNNLTPPFYIDAPSGAVYRFSGGDSGTWVQIR